MLLECYYIKYVDSAENLLDKLVYKHYRTARKSDAFLAFTDVQKPQKGKTIVFEPFFNH
jgi:hypothetical protein